MFEEIKKQFCIDTLKELQNISVKLSEIVLPDDSSLLVNKIFSITHQISGTGPMLGFDEVAKLSRKIEPIFADISNSKKELTPQIILQTKRVIDSMIKSMNDDLSSRMALLNKA